MAAPNKLLTSLKLVQLDSLVENVAEEAYKSLQNLTGSLKDAQDDAKKRALLLHLHTTRQRLQRLDVLLQWCNKAPAVAECKRVMEVAAAHSDAFRDAADQLAYLHAELSNGKAPSYDVPTAFHVLRHGGYSALPIIIEDELKTLTGGTQNQINNPEGAAASAEENSAALRRLDFLIRCKLLDEGIPEGMRVVKVGGGIATVASSKGAYYQASMSLVPAPPEEVTLAKWDPNNTGNAPAVHKEGEEVQGGVNAQVGVEDGGVEEGAEGPTAMEIETEGIEEAAAPEQEEGKQNQPEHERSEIAHWRWRLLSFDILPGTSSQALGPRLVQWLQRNIEDRMWAAGDIQELTRLGKSHLVVVPPPPLSREERDRKQRERDDQGRGLLSSKPASGAGGASGGLGGRGGASSGPSGSGTGAAAPSSSGAPGPSSFSQLETTNNPSGALPALSKQSTKEGIKQGISGAPGDIPTWAQSPLAALHSVLQHAASKLAVGLLLLEDARRMEEGAWAGHLRTGKVPTGSGLRLVLWPHVPIVAYEDVEKLRHQKPISIIIPASGSGVRSDGVSAQSLDNGALEAAVPSLPPAVPVPVPVPVPPTSSATNTTALGCAVDVTISDTGGIVCTTLPKLRDPSTGDDLPLNPFTPQGATSTEGILAEAAGACAALQLSGIREVLLQDAEKLQSTLGDGWSAEVVGGRKSSADNAAGTAGITAGTTAGNTTTSVLQPHAPPALVLSVQNEVYLLVHINLKTGAPVLSLGHSLSEDGAVAEVAQGIVQRAQRDLDRRVEEARAGPLTPGATRGTTWALAAGHIAGTVWKQLAYEIRKALIASVAIPAGFSRAALPQSIIKKKGQQQQQQSIILSDATLALGVPRFPPSMALCTFEDIPMGSRGSLLGLVLCDVGQVSATTGVSSEGCSAAGAVSGCSLAVLSATPRGIPTSLLKIIPCPPEVLAPSFSSSSGLPKGARPGSGGRRKRKAVNEEDGQGGSGAGGGGLGNEGGASSNALSTVDWPRVLDWCQRTLAIEQLRTQVELTGARVEVQENQGDSDTLLTISDVPEFNELVRQAKELQFGTTDAAENAAPVAPVAGAAGSAYATEDLENTRLHMKLLKTIEDSSASASVSKGEWIMHIDDEINSEYFSAWCEWLVAAGAPKPEESLVGVGSLSVGERGLQIHLSLAEGHSALDAIAQAVGMVKTQIFAAKLVKTLGSPSSSASLFAPPGATGSVTLSSIKLNSMVLTIAPILAGHQRQDTETLHPVTLSLDWVQRKITAVSPVSSDSKYPQIDGNSNGASNGGNPTINSPTLHIGCRVTSEPPLPPWVLSALEKQVDANTSELSVFLESLAHAVLPAAVLQQHALSPTAQHAAGLIPGALTVERCSFGPGEGKDHTDNTEAKESDPSISSFGHCLLLIRQLGRALQIGVYFEKEGGVVVRCRQIPPPVVCSSEEENTTWVSAAWDYVSNATGCQVEVKEGVLGKHFVVHMSAAGLAVALPVLLAAVARK